MVWVSFCYNSESTEAQRPAGSVCAHAGDGRPYLAQGSSSQYNRRSRLSVHVRRSVRRERVITNRVAYTLYAGLMPQRQAITMIIVYCSKPQQTDAVTPTPLTHRSHTCMRALALVHDNSLTLKCRTRMCFDLLLEMGLTARRLALLLSPHSVGFFAVIVKSVHNCLIHISSFAALLIAISSASVVSPAMMSCLLERQNTQFPYILNTIQDTLFRLTPLAKSASEYTSTTLSLSR